MSRLVSRAQGGWCSRACTKRGFGKLREEAGWGMVLQFLLLWLFRRWRRKPAKRFELLTLAIALPDAICCTFVSSLCNPFHYWVYPSPMHTCLME